MLVKMCRRAYLRYRCIYFKTFKLIINNTNIDK